MGWKTEKRKVSELKEWDKNPRLLTDKGIAQLRESIKKFGLAEPLVINRDNVICGGHGRRKALLLEGHEYADCYVPDQLLTPKEFEELNIRLNKNIAGKFDFEMLGNEFELPDLLEWGFDLDELDGCDFNVEVLDPQSDEDEVPEVKPDPITKLGDVWLLGEHRVMCGDSTMIDSVEKLMAGKKADMVFTDPPYGVDYSGGIQFTKSGAKKGQRERLVNDHSEEIYTNSVPIMASYCNGPIYTWYAASKEKELYNSISENGDYHAMIVWVKNGGYGALNATYKQKHEPCVFWKPFGKKLNFIGPTTENTIWEINKDGKNKLHPTQKPVTLAERAILNHDASIVFDLFLGSGSTLIACEKTKRTCYGMELDPQYCDVICQRWMKYTGKEATLEATGQKYSDLTK